MTTNRPDVSSDAPCSDIVYPVIPTDIFKAEKLYRESRDLHAKGTNDRRALVVYISSMMQLNHTHELFYLSHKLSSSFPNDAITWFCIGVYYWTCGKLEQARNQLKKALKRNKDLVPACFLLGHVLSALEESEQALAAYRTAVRLMPQHWLPLLCIGKEFIRTNNLWLAVHTLQSAHAMCPLDVGVLNELGVAFLKLGKPDDAAECLQVAILQVQEMMASEECAPDTSAALSISNTSVCELFYNYATAQRKMNNLDDALTWYQRSLSLGPLKPTIIASIAYTHHLSRRFEEAVSLYHQALSLDPQLTFCGEMLSNAMADMLFYAPFEPNQQ